MKTKNNLHLAVSIVLFLVIGCSSAPNGLNQEIPYEREQETPLYSGGPAIIFRLDDVTADFNEEAVEQIMKLFAANNVPLDVGVVPHAGGIDSYHMPLLRNYLDAGVIDISMHGYDKAYMEFDTAQSGTNYEELKANLEKARKQFEHYFGDTPVACTVPYDFFNEDGYRAVQDAGFKIFSTQTAVEPHPSIKPADYSGNEAKDGMYRLPTAASVSRWDAEQQKWGDIFSADMDNQLFRSVNLALNTLEVAVIGIQTESFMDKNGNLDHVKLGKLDDIVKLSMELGEITTFEGWYRCAAEWILGPPYGREQETPLFSGGRAIIFRLDDVTTGFHEEAVEQIIKLFAANNAPLDVGVVPHVGGVNSYPMPFLRKYLDAGVVDISIHGYDWTYAQLDTDKSGTNYEELKANLEKARKQLEYYFGDTPVACTVPNDFFNEDGYRAVQDAGFNIFSTQAAVEPHPSAEPVDYFGNEDENGMYRLPAAINVSRWDAEQRKWGDVFSADIDNQLFRSVNLGFATLGVAVIGIHTQAFVDDEGNMDPVKLAKLDGIIKLSRELGEITTFEGWYRYTAEGILGPPYKRMQETPLFSGGRAIIFRLDDVTTGFHEEAVKEIIELFEKNDVPLDLGVISRANGVDSFRMPFLRKYLDAGVVDISVHGYDWTYAQLDTDKSGTNYEELKAKLIKAREQYKHYFGVDPVACTVPTDIFNWDGYRAVQDAGFKVFATHSYNEPHASTESVDYFGRETENGMYRISTASDVAGWDDKTRQWGAIYSANLGNELFAMLYVVLDNLGVAAVSMHPDAFLDDEGKVDPVKLAKLDDIIKLSQDFGEITTFEGWYRYAAEERALKVSP